MADRLRPTTALSAHQRDGIRLSPQGEAFLATLDERAWKLLDEHDLRWDGVLGNGEYSVTMMCTMRVDGRRVVLKLDPEINRLANQCRVQKVWARQGVAPHISYEEAGVCIMDWVPAGYSTWRSDKATRNIRTTTAALETAWHAPGLVDDLRPGKFWWVFRICRARLSEMAAERGDEAVSLPLTDESFDRAQLMIDELRTLQPAGVCHGDPTVANILRENSGKIWLIDPLPSADPLICGLAHWSCRARTGHSAENILRRALTRVDTSVSEDEIRGWLAFHTIAPVTSLLVRGEDIPAEMLKNLEPLR